MSFAPELGITDYDVVYERSLAAVKELSKDAERLKVSIGLENVWNNFLLSPLEMRDFIDKVGSRYVGSYFDVGNVVFSGYPEQWIKILGNRIKKCISKITAAASVRWTVLLICSRAKLTGKR